jgi:cytosine/adenosine deaminase-related metal-dependent hydrolase
MIVLDGCAVATGTGLAYSAGHVAFEGDRIVSVGRRGAGPPGDRIDASGRLATAGLVNCHHHLYQWATRGLAQRATLFEWLVELYPTWARLDASILRAAARAGLAALLRSGCTTASDHHYVFPHGAGDLLAVEIEAARDLGIRFHPCRGAMDLGVSAGGLPPDSVVEDRDAILAACATAIDTHHDPSPGSMLQIALAPCSPFSVTRELMVETAELARARDVRLHTHMAETVEEEAFCQERFGMRPLDYLEDLGWLGGDVWLAHCVHLDDDEVVRLVETGTCVAHCPSSNARLGAGIAPVTQLVRHGGSVGLGVDGAASNEAGELGGEMRQALLLARLRGGPAAMDPHEALTLATVHGARCLGRSHELGALAPGMLADIVLWRLDDLDHAGIEDPVAALVLGPRPLAETVFVGGRAVVEGGELRTGDVETIASELAAASRRLAAGGPS